MMDSGNLTYIKEVFPQKKNVLSGGGSNFTLFAGCKLFYEMKDQQFNQLLK